jgi:hypothetical protein
MSHGFNVRSLATWKKDLALIEGKGWYHFAVDNSYILWAYLVTEVISDFFSMLGKK